MISKISINRKKIRYGQTVQVVDRCLYHLAVVVIIRVQFQVLQEIIGKGRGDVSWIKQGLVSRTTTDSDSPTSIKLKCKEHDATPDHDPQVNLPDQAAFFSFGPNCFGIET